IVSRELAEEVVVPRLTGPQKDELRSGLGQEGLNHFGDQVESFLVGQPPNDSNRRRPGRNVEPGLALELSLAHLLTGDIVRGVALGDVLIPGRVENVVVDTVDDAPQVVAAAP